MRHVSRGQAALEYMVTYGWVFMVVMVTLGALSFFGVITPSKWLPDKCDFGQQLVCADYELSSAGNGMARIQVRNSFGRAINITGANIALQNGTSVGTFSVPWISIPANEIREITISNVNAGGQKILTSKTKQQLRIHLTFAKSTISGQPVPQSHTLAGIVYTTTK